MFTHAIFLPLFRWPYHYRRIKRRHTAGPNEKKLAKNRVGKFEKLTGHTYACNNLTNLCSETHSITGNGNDVNLLTIPWNSSWNHNKPILWRILTICNHCGGGKKGQRSPLSEWLKGSCNMCTPSTTTVAAWLLFLAHLGKHNLQWGKISPEGAMLLCFHEIFNWRIRNSNLWKLKKKSCKNVPYSREQEHVSVSNTPCY